MPREEVEHRRPIHTVHAGIVGRIPPVSRAGLLVRHEVVMKFAKPSNHFPRLSDRDVVVVHAVQHIHAERRVVVQHG